MLRASSAAGATRIWSTTRSRCTSTGRRRAEVGPLRVRFCEVPHFTVTHAVDLAVNGSRFTFGADCRPNDELVAFAQGTDVLMIEATLPRPERTACAAT